MCVCGGGGGGGVIMQFLELRIRHVEYRPAQSGQSWLAMW